MDTYHNIAVIGGQGAIGGALLLAIVQPQAKIDIFSRNLLKTIDKNVCFHAFDNTDEQALAQTASIAVQDGPLDLIVVVMGILHNECFKPEKSFRNIAAEQMQHLFTISTVIATLLAKYFISKLHKHKRAMFAALLARVGSISDNRLGGWYFYRAAKAALNMSIKNIAIAVARLPEQAIVVSLHPGTVDSQLSKPFQAHLPAGKLFSPKQTAQKLIKFMENLIPQDTSKCLAWESQEIAS